MPNYGELVESIRAMGGVVVGYSGGVDSTLVAKAATEALQDRAVCVLIDSCLMPRSEVDDAVAVAGQLGINLIRVKSDALGAEKVAANPPDRCYHCKLAEFSEMVEIARKRGMEFVLDGGNVDDGADYRPGQRAVAELGVRSPLKELGFTKARVREVSRELGLPTWDRPAKACLASRIPYGTRLTAEILGRVEAAESILHELGFAQCRVRHHGDVARIELLPEEMDGIFARDTRDLVVYRFRAIGYKYVALDLTGYRTGSMNEGLGNRD